MESNQTAATVTVPSIVQSAGNLPQLGLVYYTDSKAKPEVQTGADSRAVFLRYKLDKKLNQQRAHIGLAVRKLTTASLRSTSRGDEFMQDVINEVQDSVLRRVADGEISFSVAITDSEFIADYYDTSRGGKKTTKEDVIAWFELSMAEWLVGRVVSKYPQMDQTKIGKIVEQYQNTLCDLVKYSLPISKSQQLTLTKLGDEFDWSGSDEMQEWFLARMAKVETKLNAQDALIDAI